MPFEYRPFVNPYAGSIGELLEHGGDASARAAEIVAAARGRAAEVRGQAWGGAAQNIAQTVGAIPGQIAQQKRVAQEDQIRTIEAQKAQAGQKMGSLITANTKTTPDGHLVYDIDGFANAAKADPSVAPWAHEPLDAMTKANDTYQQFKEGRFATKQAALQQVYAKANEAGATVDDLKVIAAPLVTAGIISGDDIMPTISRLSQIPDQAGRSMFLRAIGNVKTQLEKVGQGDSLVDVTPGSAPSTVIQGAPKPPSAEEALIDAYMGSLKKPAGTTWAQLTPEEKAAFPTYQNSQKAPNSQESKFMLDGQPVQGDYIPGANGQSGKYFYNGQDVTARVKVIPAASVTIANQNANAPGDWDKTGDDFLATIPARWRKTVEKLARYDEDISKVTSMRGNERSMVQQWVNQVNPAWDASMFTNRAPTRKAFTTGTQGQQINAINTAIGHIDQLTGLVAQLGNGSFTPGNKAWNTVATIFGRAQVSNFDALKDALAGEVSSVLAKGGATVSGIADAKEKIGASNSPEQLAGYVNTLIPLMGSKLVELDYQFHQAMGADDPYSALSPDSKTILTKHGFDPANPTLRTTAAPTSGAAAAKEGDTKPIDGYPGAEQTYKGGKWIRTK